MTDYEYELDVVKQLISKISERAGITAYKVAGDDTPRLSGLFDSGVIVVTDAIDRWVKNADNDGAQRELRRAYLELCLTRHFAGDWGDDMPIEDMLSNEQALDDLCRIMSVFTFQFPTDDDDDGVRIWIITESDRSVTTILFPSDY
jgi:hypothetical protein